MLPAACCPAPFIIKPRPRSSMIHPSHPSASYCFDPFTMSDTFADADFKLPAQFLTDEDFLVDWKSCTQVSEAGDRVLGSVVSSPVDSLLGSLESESDEEDPISELSRTIARSTLEDGSNSASSKVRMLSASGEVARLRLSEHLYDRNGSTCSGGEALYGSPERLSLIHVSQKAQKDCDGRINHLRHQHSLFYHHLVSNQTQQLKQEQAMFKRQNQRLVRMELNRKPNNHIYQTTKPLERKPILARGAGTGWQLLGPVPSACLPVQQRSGCGMRAVFLGSNGKKSGCAGTGVFLPRGAGAHSGSRSKPACSTVLLPDKLIRALNLNLENVGSQSHIQYRLDSRLSFENDGCAWNLRKNGITTQQNPRGHSQSAALPNSEIRLPHEWTY
ncbi:hypothetical protein SAY86_029879 [Trapa natans]|uniref:Uncharacterized protein n=1 Tax=Trapa natans TaxID=22666 RepID=A0AAN7RHS7_TRANT|nr:hypothetical protein SAY86_029879 [Trapa natans]